MQDILLTSKMKRTNFVLIFKSNLNFFYKNTTLLLLIKCNKNCKAIALAMFTCTKQYHHKNFLNVQLLYNSHIISKPSKK